MAEMVCPVRGPKVVAGVGKEGGRRERGGREEGGRREDRS
jgi:hypothetical protein